MSRHTRYRGAIKPAFDVVVAGVALVVCLPLLAAAAVAVRLTLGSPVIFAQLRPGKDGRPFRCYKFRTMTDDRDAAGRLLPDERRLTPFGRWLRSTSLDELPELWNVLRGEMSLVGPRPLLMDYLKHYTLRQSRRNEVRPGITGWAQVHGRNATSWDERLELDVWYVEHASLWIDLKILAKSVVTVLSRQGVNAASHATMPRFDERSSQEAPHADAA